MSSSVKFTAIPLLSDVSQLDDLIFKRGQESIDRDLNEFVYEFETRPDITTLDSLAKTYVQLSNCDQKLKSFTNPVDLSHKLKSVQADLTQLLSSVQQKTPNISAFQQDRVAYLEEKSKRHKKMVLELQRQADMVDEFYSKKTRESIYRNLVNISL